MKKLYFSALLLLTTGVFGQTGISFNDTLRPFGPGGDGFANVIEDLDSYYALSFLNSAIGQYPYLLELDNYGNILNEKMYIDTNYNYAIYPYNSMVLKDSLLLFCGQIWNNSIGNLGFVFAINKYTLDTLWTKTYTHPDTLIAQTAQDVFSVLTAIKPAPDGGYILTGNYNKDCITGNMRSFLMKIDSVGNVEWRKTYDSIYGLYDIELSTTNGFVLINKYWGPHVVETDSLGNIIWQKKINNYTINATVSDFTSTGNNSFVGIVKYLSGGTVSNPIYGLNVFKVNLSNHQILWDKTYQLYKSLQCISMHQAMGVETLPNGDIIVSGTAKNYGHDAVILKLNSNGDSLWCKSYDFDPDPWDCQLNDLIITEDGGFMGVGFFSDQNGPGWTAWMFKTDDNGTIGWESPKFEGSRLKVFPNPARDYTIIELPESLKNTATLKVYNSPGQLVFQKILNKGKKTIKLDVRGFDTGVYFFEIMGEGGVMGSSRFVRE
jgi:hypothetical protein